MIAVRYAIVVGLFASGVGMWFWPDFNGFLFDPTDMSVGVSRIIAAIFLVGAAILFFMPPSAND
jgi:hypothetical protein